MAQISENGALVFRNKTFSQILDENAQKFPHKEALIDRKRRLTFQEVNLWTDAMARMLVEQGLPKRSVFLVQLPNVAELYLLKMACEKAGLVFLQASIRYRYVELKHIINHVEAEGIVIPGMYGNFDYFRMINENRHELPSLKKIFVLSEAVPEGAISFSDAFEQSLREAGKDTIDIKGRRFGPDEVFFLNHSSGTTGMPKIVAYTAGGRVCYGAAHAERIAATEEDIFSVFAPAAGGPNLLAYHVGPVVGGKLVMLDKFEAQAALELIEKERISIVGIVPTQLIKMTDHPKFHDYDLSSVRMIMVTSAPLSYPVASDAEEKWQCPICQGYGTVDSGFNALNSPSAPKETRIATAGRPAPGGEVMVIDEQNRRLNAGEVGELLVKGPFCAVGFFRNPGGTKEVWLDDGWIKTGDLAKLDPEGHLVIVGKKKDMIIRGGYNIFPIEVESLIIQNPTVRDVAVVGIPDPVLGEKSCACIVPKAGMHLSLEDLCRFLREKGLSPFKLPERLEMFDELPMVQGDLKIDKKSLRQVCLNKLKEEGLID